VTGFINFLCDCLAATRVEKEAGSPPLWNARFVQRRIPGDWLLCPQAEQPPATTKRPAVDRAACPRPTAQQGQTERSFLIQRRIPRDWLLCPQAKQPPATTQRAAVDRVACPRPTAQPRPPAPQTWGNSRQRPQTLFSSREADVSFPID
jgi:hypothetical protein